MYTMHMRIRDLAEATGISKTTIHFYQREGLLPPPLDKSAPNAALYGEVHVQRLKLVSELRQARLPIAHLKRAIALIDQGVPVDTALALQQALTAGDGEHHMDTKALAAAAGVTQAAIKDYAARGLLGDTDRRRFGQADVDAVRALSRMGQHGIGAPFLQECAERVQALIAAEFALADAVTAKLTQAERSTALLAMQDSVDCLHTFWLDQARRQQVFSRWPASLQKLVKDAQ